MKIEKLYHDKEIELERFDDGSYRVTLFNKDNHWNGDIHFNSDGIIYESLSD